MALRNELIEEIRNRANIVSLISSYIPVTRKGRNYFAVCPFHNDTNPSMSISEEKQIYKCFSCGAGGNVFTFVQEYEKVNFIEAVKIVASFVGMDISKDLEKENVKKVSDSEKRMYQILKEAEEFYHYNLETEDGLKGKEYLLKREIDENIISQFSIGYSTNDGDKIINYLMKKGYSIDEILLSGIGVENSSKLVDRFKGRVIFPLKDLEGKTVAFSGRKIDDLDVAKYVNSPETEIFIKGNCLYNYHIAKTSSKKEGVIYVVEGFMDVIALSKIGISNVVGIMGTSFTENQIKAIKRLNVKVVMALDNDDAGQDATFKVLNELEKNNLNVSVVRKNENGKDLDELLKHGKDKVLEYLKDTLSPLDFKISYQFSRINTENHEEKKELIQKIATYFLGKSSDSLDKDYYINRLSSLTGFSYQAIKNILDASKPTFKKKTYSSYKPIRVSLPDRYDKAQRNIISQVLNDPKAVRYCADNLNIFTHSEYRMIAKYAINYYYDKSMVSEEGILSTITDTNLTRIVTDIMYEDGLEKSFDVNYFNMLKLELPILSEIESIKEKIESTLDIEEKTKLSILKNKKTKELKELRNSFLKGGN